MSGQRFMWPEPNDDLVFKIFCAVWWGVVGAFAGFVLVIFIAGLVSLL